MARRRWIYPRDGEPFEVTDDYIAEPPQAPAVMPDLPGYQSPVSGIWVEGRRSRREDLKRHNCRPYEGFEQENKEAQKHRQEQAVKLDRKLDEAAWRSYYELPPRKREILRRGLK